MLKVGKITKVIFNNPSNGYTVAIFKTDDGSITLTGCFHTIDYDATYEVQGDFRVHPKYGEQFVIESYSERMPNDSDGIIAFLSSGAIRGVGPKIAQSIVENFGEQTLNVIEREPERLLTISGIGPKSMAKIAESYTEHREFAMISLELREYGIETNDAIKIYKLYGAAAIDVVRENPYCLIADIYGLTFQRADEIAERAGIDPNSDFRIASGIKFCLSDFAFSGSTFIPREVLVERVIDLLDVATEQVLECCRTLSILDEIKTDTIEGIEVIYLYNYYRAEERVAYNISRLINQGNAPLPVDLDNLIADAEANRGIAISEEQKHAVKTALSESVCIITGGPGTGKTTIINAIVTALSRMGISFALAAPTGRAAKRMAEASGYPAQTIHRLLEYVFSEDDKRMEFGRNVANPLEKHVIIVDEASMIDILLMDGLLQAIKTGSRLVIVGDVDQLPSVGAGNALRDMIESEYIPTVRLREIFRQAEESKIVVNAHLINNGEYPEGGGDDFYFMHKDSEQDILDAIKELVGGRLSAYYDFVKSNRDIQVLTPTKRGQLGTLSLNVALQEMLNPAEKDKNERRLGSKLFREGDKVMQIRNNYQKQWRDDDMRMGDGVFNGDMGMVEIIDNDSGKVYVRFDDRVAYYEGLDLEDLELAYAVTVHKSQGSEFPVVIIPMSFFPPMLMSRNLLYTGVTRAKNLVVLIGQERRMKQMIDNDRTDERYTGLAARLRKYDLGIV